MNMSKLLTDSGELQGDTETVLNHVLESCAQRDTAAALNLALESCEIGNHPYQISQERYL